MAKKKKSSGRDEDLFRIASFMLFDALVFHQVLSNGHVDITPVSKRDTQALQQWLRVQWLHIRNNINYKPVFDLAIDIVDALPPSPDTERLLGVLSDAAVDAVRSGILLKHDFMGRIYHKLLLSTTGHYYATYYTSIPAAWLLAGLVIREPHRKWDFGEIKELDEFRLIDPACGSGTLLSAAYSAIKDQYIKSAIGELNINLLHEVLLSRSIYGYDVLDFAAHLSLTNLALHSDTVSADSSNIYRMPLGAGGETVQLGSLEYLRRSSELKGIALVESVEGFDFEGRREIELKRQEFDVVLMNPPFSRSAKPNLNFGYTEAEARKRMQASLAQLSKDLGLQKAAVAGLTPFFMILGLEMVKREGRIGLVAPRSTLSGVGTKQVRQRYERETNVRYIVSNFDPGSKVERVDGWSWSENTDLGEVLIVAQANATGHDSDANPATTFVNVLRKPRNEAEALILSQEVLKLVKSKDLDLLSGKDHAISVLGKPTAVVYQVKQRTLSGNWLGPCTFASPALNRVGLEIAASSDLECIDKQLAVVNRELAMGRDIAGIKQNFTRHPVTADARLVLGHQAVMNTLEMDGAHVVHAKGKDSKATAMFKQFGGTLLVAERPHLKTESLLAMRSPERVLTTAFWELQLKKEVPEEWLLLWLNSTYGFMTFLAASTSSQGDIFKMKKDQLRMLNVISFNRKHAPDAKALYKQLGKSPFYPYGIEFSMAATGKGSRFMIDRFFSSRFGLPSLDSQIYLALVCDPVISKSALQ